MPLISSSNDFLSMTFYLMIQSACVKRIERDILCLRSQPSIFFSFLCKTKKKINISYYLQVVFGNRKIVENLYIDSVEAN